MGRGAPERWKAKGQVSTLAWASSRERLRRSCCFVGPGEAWGGGSSGDAWERTLRSSLRCVYWSWALRRACIASFWGQGRSSQPPFLPSPGLLSLTPGLTIRFCSFIHCSLNSFLHFSISVRLAARGWQMMGDGNVVSGPPDPSILRGHVPFILWTLLWVCTLEGWGVCSPRPTLPQPPVPTKRLSGHFSLSASTQRCQDFLGTLSTSPCAPPTNKSTILQLHRKTGVNLCCVTLGKFLSIHGPLLPHRLNGTGGNGATCCAAVGSMASLPGSSLFSAEPPCPRPGLPG